VYSKGHLVNGCLAAASAAWVWLSFPPVDFGAAAWVALVPWLVLIGRTPRRTAAIWSAIAGYGLFLALVHWIRFVSIAGWLSLALYCAAYWPVAALLIGWLRRRGVAFALSAPLTITVLEFVRGNLFTGFPFYFLGHSQHRYLALIQIADVTGTFGVTFLIALVNGCVADRIGDRFSARRRAVATCIATAAVVLLAACYGLIRMGSGQTRPGPTVALIQANIPLDLKHTPSLDEHLKVLRKHVALSKQVSDQEVDMVIWPETMFPAPMNYVSKPEMIQSMLTDSRKEYREYAAFLAGCSAELRRAWKTTGTHLLIGAETRNQERFNSAYLFSPQGKVLGRYDKIHLVVFGEYTPLTHVLPVLRLFRPQVMGRDLSAGKLRWLFDLPDQEGRTHRFGVTICYEDAEPGLFRKFVRDGADFMVNITNDGWFRDSSELDHHLAICAFRAVENRVPIARCANTGISALIAPDGRITERVTQPDGRYREVEGTLVGRLDMTDLNSFYSAYGDLFAWLCVVALLLASAGVLLRRKVP